MFRKMIVEQKAALKKYRGEVYDTLEPLIDNVVLDFTDKGHSRPSFRLFSLHSMQLVTSETRPYSKIFKFLQMLDAHEKGFDALIDACLFYNMPGLANKLQLEYDRQRYAASEDFDHECGVIPNLTVKPSEPEFALLLRKTQKVYKNSTTPRGRALVIGNHFPNAATPRNGSKTDVANLKALLPGLQYELILHEDVTKPDMLTIFQDFARKDWGNYDSALVFVMSHGMSNQIQCADQQFIDIDFLVSQLDGNNCPGLLGKPKILFFQSCKVEINGNSSSSSKNDNNSMDSMEDECDASVEELVAVKEDILEVHSTYHGYPAWRNPTWGSHFIYAICQVFARYACEEEIYALLLRVRWLVRESVVATLERKEKEAKKEGKLFPTASKIQVPTDRGSFMKKFYFFP